MTDNNEKRGPGRPRLHQDQAGKQWAYRQRKQDQRAELVDAVRGFLVSQGFNPRNEADMAQILRVLTPNHHSELAELDAAMQKLITAL